MAEDIIPGHETVGNGLVDELQKSDYCFLCSADGEFFAGVADDPSQEVLRSMNYRTAG